jgi:hypothetical protein
MDVGHKPNHVKFMSIFSLMLQLFSVFLDSYTNFYRHNVLKCLFLYSSIRHKPANKTPPTLHMWICHFVLHDGDAHFLPFCQRHFPTQCFKQVHHTRFTRVQYLEKQTNQPVTIHSQPKAAGDWTLTPWYFLERKPRGRTQF